ncbi:hypothetical protein [Proteiniclasticum sp.]|uniref:hypothetical protein n=1 Tax=Proteiniclasticum sp. TaxID=2053595 RepID=UPI0028A04D7A|nr:hypothetical protein [Proteiniclasticum sp.]
MANLFEKKERSPLYQVLLMVFLIALMALGNNERLRTIPSAYVSFRLVQIIFSIYLLVKGVLLILGTWKERKKRTGTENLQILFVGIALILLAYVATDITLHTVNYMSTL